MPEEARKTYSLSEAAKAIGVDETAIHRCAHKGLIAPQFSNHNGARLNTVEFVRLKAIIRADEMGYEPEDILHLLGSPVKVLAANDPVFAFHDFAMGKYKQIREELELCEPLEKIQKKCDLRLISTYIQDLKRLQKKQPPLTSQRVPHIAQRVSTRENQAATSVTSVPITGHRPTVHPKKVSNTTWLLFILASLFLVLAIVFFSRLHSNPEIKSHNRAIGNSSGLPDLQKPDGSDLLSVSVPNPPPPLRPTKELPTIQTVEAEGEKPEAKLNTEVESTVKAVPPVAGWPEPLVKIDALSVQHDGSANIYRVAFNVIKNPAVMDPERVSGYAFVRLEIEDETGAVGKIIIPPVDFLAGNPVSLPPKGRFVIRNLKPMRFEELWAIQPGEIARATVMVYSPEGDLLLEESIDVPIQSFVREPEKRMIASDRSGTADRRSTTDAPTSSTSPATVDIRAASQVTPPGLPPITKPEKTDNPEAITWERQSYNAARQGDLDRAIADASKAIELDPGRVHSYINRSWAYIEKGLVAKALQDTHTALAIDPDNAYAHNNQGLAYQSMGLIQIAKENYSKACNLGLELGCRNLTVLENQSRIDFLIDRSQAAFNARDWDSVIRDATEVIDLDPQNALAYTNRSAAYAQKGLLNKALKDSNDAVKYNPEFGLAYNNRGYVYELLGNDRRAAADYQKSCRSGFDLGCKNYERFNKQP